MDDNTDRENQLDEVTASRRTVLKAVGIAAISAAVPALAPGQRSFAQSTQGQTGDLTVPPPLIENAVQIALSSPLLARETERLQQAKLLFELSASAVKQAAELQNLIGLQFETVGTPSPRFGASLHTTVNTQTSELVSLQVVMCWSLLETLQIYSMIFDGTLPFEIEPLGYRDEEERLRRTYEPRIEKRWSFPRVEPLLPQPEELVEQGWPPELPGYPRWHYGGAPKSDWLTLDSTLIFACQEIAEVFSDQSVAPRISKLDYTFAPKVEPATP